MDLNKRQRAGLHVLFFILKMLKPSGYEHEISQLQDKVEAELDRVVTDTE